jgi:hypothetical protein
MKHWFSRHQIRASVLIEVVVAIAMLIGVVLPLGIHLYSDHKSARNYYYRASAMEIVDGEMEILAAGEWKAFSDGTHAYPIKAEAAKNLPVGEFRLTKKSKTIRLEWIPTEKNRGGSVKREIQLP